MNQLQSVVEGERVNSESESKNDLNQLLLLYLLKKLATNFQRRAPSNNRTSARLPALSSLSALLFLWPLRDKDLLIWLPSLKLPVLVPKEPLVNSRNGG
jgi:hypothetical protein